MPHDTITFVPSHWLAETARISPAARGVWITVLAQMVFVGCDGVLTMSWPDLARLCGASIDDTKRLVLELYSQGVCGLANERDLKMSPICPSNVPGTVHPNIQDTVCILSRRLQREAKQRGEWRLKKQQQRMSKQCPDGSLKNVHFPPNSDISPPSYSPLSSENIRTPGENTPRPLNVPRPTSELPTLKEVVANGEMIGMTPDESTDWFHGMEAKGWMQGITPVANWRALQTKHKKFYEERRHLKARAPGPTNPKPPNVNMEHWWAFLKEVWPDAFDKKTMPNVASKTILVEFKNWETKTYA